VGYSSCFFFSPSQGPQPSLANTAIPALPIHTSIPSTFSNFYESHYGLGHLPPRSRRLALPHDNLYWTARHLNPILTKTVMPAIIHVHFNLASIPLSLPPLMQLPWLVNHLGVVEILGIRSCRLLRHHLSPPFHPTATCRRVHQAHYVSEDQRRGRELD
jgi:hypothetical protein